MKTAWLLFISFAFLSCNGLPSKTDAKELVRQTLMERGQTDGGSPVTVTDVTILTITKEGDKAKIDFTWSGVRRSPAIAHPRSPESINSEKNAIYIVKRNGEWKTTTDE